MVNLNQRNRESLENGASCEQSTQGCRLGVVITGGGYRRREAIQWRLFSTGSAAHKVLFVSYCCSILLFFFLSFFIPCYVALVISTWLSLSAGLSLCWNKDWNNSSTSGGTAMTHWADIYSSQVMLWWLSDSFSSGAFMGFTFLDFGELPRHVLDGFHEIWCRYMVDWMNCNQFGEYFNV